MREIKFRGKSLTTGKWVYGSLVMYQGEKTHPDIYDAESSQYISVWRESLGQYTGLKDKNGVEIYEGDVIELFDHFPYRSPVAWSATDGSWFTRNFSPSEWNQASIIGNIYENPELLEQSL